MLPRTRLSVIQDEDCPELENLIPQDDGLGQSEAPSETAPETNNALRKGRFGMKLVDYSQFGRKASKRLGETRKNNSFLSKEFPQPRRYKSMPDFYRNLVKHHIVRYASTPRMHKSKSLKRISLNLQNRDPHVYYNIDKFDNGFMSEPATRVHSMYENPDDSAHDEEDDLFQLASLDIKQTTQGHPRSDLCRPLVQTNTSQESAAFTQKSTLDKGDNEDVTRPVESRNFKTRQVYSGPSVTALVHI